MDAEPELLCMHNSETIHNNYSDNEKLLQKCEPCTSPAFRHTCIEINVMYRASKLFV